MSRSARKLRIRRLGVRIPSGARKVETAKPRNPLVTGGFVLSAVMSAVVTRRERRPRRPRCIGQRQRIRPGVRRDTLELDPRGLIQLDPPGGGEVSVQQVILPGCRCWCACFWTFAEALVALARRWLGAVSLWLDHDGPPVFLGCAAHLRVLNTASDWAVRPKERGMLPHRGHQPGARGPEAHR